MLYKSKWHPWQKVMQKLIGDYTDLWPVLKPSKAGEYFAFCNVCISHDDLDDFDQETR